MIILLKRAIEKAVLLNHHSKCKKMEENYNYKAKSVIQIRIPNINIKKSVKLVRSLIKAGDG